MAMYCALPELGFRASLTPKNNSERTKHLSQTPLKNRGEMEKARAFHAERKTSCLARTIWDLFLVRS